jgi:hypothetical protein
MPDAPGAYYIPLAVIKPLPPAEYTQESGKVFADTRFFRYKQRDSHLVPYGLFSCFFARRILSNKQLKRI